jgi:hypothetical protein
MAMGRLQLASHTGTAAKRVPRDAQSTGSVGPSSGAPSIQAGNSAAAPTAFGQMLMSAMPAARSSDQERAAQPVFASSAEVEAQSIFEFSGLGMFGLNAAAAEDAQNEADEMKAGTRSAADAPFDVGLEADGAGQSEQVGSGGAIGAATDTPIAWSANASYPDDLTFDARALDTSGNVMAAAVTRAATSVSFEMEPTSAAVIANKPTGDEPNEVGEGSASPSALPSALKEQSPDTSAVFVFGPDDAAQVAVRVPDARNAGVIREAIERTAAEYGVRVDELHINGSANPSDFSLKGTPRGRNTR